MKRLHQIKVTETMKGMADPHCARSALIKEVAVDLYHYLGDDDFIIRRRGDVVTVEIRLDEVFPGGYEKYKRQEEA
jgi:hypothetical protein